VGSGAGHLAAGGVGDTHSTGPKNPFSLRTGFPRATFRLGELQVLVDAPSWHSHTRVYGGQMRPVPLLVGAALLAVVGLVIYVLLAAPPNMIGGPVP
jgi:hypothetical protein